MSTRLKITAALREGQRRGLVGKALESHVNQVAGVNRMTPVELRLAATVYRTAVWPKTRPPKPKSCQGRLPL